MRLRQGAAAAFGALALLAAQSGSASAAAGDFSYTYAGLDGMPRTVTLHEPPSPGCVTLPEVADTRASEPAFAPQNGTDEWAMVFTGTDCTGDSWTLRPHGLPASDQLKLRSVYLTGRH
ncbi:hypothetical protein ACIQZN_34455 [Streptomyces sp. NPDC097595]|uniref:hypothetical protein n=1 Tax=Streptomyces sp. NPDC097595 TaxID=3366090 RepID=UPI00380F092D